MILRNTRLLLLRTAAIVCASSIGCDPSAVDEFETHVSHPGASTTPSATRPSEPGAATALHWDLRRGRGLEVFSWPADYEGVDLGYDAQFLWKVTSNCTVMITTADGIEGTYRVRGFQVTRKHDTVVSFGLQFECEGAQAAYERAKAINDQWSVGQLEYLETWYRSFGPKGTGKGITNCGMQGRRPDGSTVGVSVFQCSVRDETWHVLLSMMHR